MMGPFFFWSKGKVFQTRYINRLASQAACGFHEINLQESMPVQHFNFTHGIFISLIESMSA
jgi:hypothetical protein